MLVSRQSRSESTDSVISGLEDENSISCEMLHTQTFLTFLDNCYRSTARQMPVSEINEKGVVDYRLLWSLFPPNYNISFHEPVTKVQMGGKVSPHQILADDRFYDQSIVRFKEMKLL
jgi:hypothetical protein